MSASMPNTAELARPFLPFLQAIEGDHWIEPLRDGTPVLIRPLRPDDREREEDFLSRLSPQARRLRFLGTISEVTPALVDQLMDVDNVGRVAFVALVHEDGKLREIGVSRYCVSDDRKQCECAVTVAEDWQGRGLGVLLMQHLIGMARRQGFTRMFSIDAADNQGMRDLAGYLGFHRGLDPGDSTQVIHSLDLR